MLTGDGIEVDWKHSRSPVASFITAEKLALLESPDCAIRAYETAALTRAQVGILYSAAKVQRLKTALRRWTLGKRIRQADCLDYCLGSYEDKLWRIFGKFPARQYQIGWQRSDLIRVLLKEV